MLKQVLRVGLMASMTAGTVLAKPETPDVPETAGAAVEGVFRPVAAEGKQVTKNIPKDTMEVPAERRFPEGFDPETLNVPEMNSLSDFMEFTEHIRAISVDDEPKFEEVDPGEGPVWAVRYYHELIHAKHRAVIEAADKLLAKTSNEQELYQIHAIKHFEFRFHKYLNDQVRAEFDQYHRELSISPIEKLRAIPEGYDLIMGSAWTAVDNGSEDEHKGLLPSIFAYYDKYGVDEVTAYPSEKIANMYNSDAHQQMKKALFNGLAERFGKAHQTDRIKQLTNRYRKQAAALNAPGS